MPFAQQKVSLPNGKEGPPACPRADDPSPRRGSPGLQHSLPFRRASIKKQECPCGNLLFDLVFESVRQRVGCGSLLTLNLGEMSIAVERFRLTATGLRRDILTGYSVRGKLILVPSGGNS